MPNNETCKMLLAIYTSTHTRQGGKERKIHMVSKYLQQYRSKQYFVGNKPFAQSGHMVQNKLHWDANNAVGLSKQTKVGVDW